MPKHAGQHRHSLSGPPARASAGQNPPKLGRYPHPQWDWRCWDVLVGLGWLQFPSAPFSKR